jgi:hypothetical protein
MNGSHLTLVQHGDERTTTFPDVLRLCAAPNQRCDPDAVGSST